VSFTLNGVARRIEVDDDRRLLWVLRTDLGLTGTKFGCGEAQCGACTVVVDRHAVRSCQTPLWTVEGKAVMTIEGLGGAAGLHPLQQAFVDHGALQCGFCTPGMLMASYALLSDTPAPSRAQIVARLDRNLCRCGTQTRVIAAIESLRRRAAGGRS
jgi:aerobic-type carbon monoxide dehydrogenase small subunit (CoxS/CutS family)